MIINITYSEEEYNFSESLTVEINDDVNFDDFAKDFTEYTKKYIEREDEGEGIQVNEIINSFFEEYPKYKKNTNQELHTIQFNEYCEFEIDADESIELD